MTDAISGQLTLPFDAAEKRCCTCREVVPLAGFYNDRSQRDGKTRDCKPCRNVKIRRTKATAKARGHARRAALLARTEKPCRKCGAIKPMTEFMRNSRLASGRGETCKDCHNARQRRRFQTDEHARAMSAESLRRYRARLLSAPTIPFTTRQLDERMSMFGHRCWMCGGPFEHVDHVKPLAKGGSHMLCNLRPACGPCNFGKSARWPLHISVYRSPRRTLPTGWSLRSSM